MASTFDPELIQKVGGFLAAEAKSKSSVVLLAPTCNIQRSPLGGRAFESFSEDPYLSGTMSASYVNGLQAEGVSASLYPSPLPLNYHVQIFPAIKHLVANDQEHEVIYSALFIFLPVESYSAHCRRVRHVRQGTTRDIFISVCVH